MSVADISTSPASRQRQQIMRSAGGGLRKAAFAAIVVLLCGGAIAQQANRPLSASANRKLDISTSQSSAAAETAAPSQGSANPAPDSEVPVEVTPADKAPATAAIAAEDKPSAAAEAASDNSRENKLLGSGVQNSLAVDERPVGMADSGDSDSSIIQWLKTLGALALVLGIIYALSRLLKRWNTGSGGSGGGVVEVLTRTAITHRHGVSLVRVGNRVFVVGVSPENINRIGEINDAAEVGDILGALQSQRRDSISRSFNSALDEKRMELELQEQALEHMDLSEPVSDDADAGHQDHSTDTHAMVDKLDAMLRKLKGLGGDSQGGGR